MTIADAIYALCAATSLTAAGLLLRHYASRRSRLLLWSCVAFVGLAVNNVLVLLDFGVLPGVDLSVVRMLTAAVSMAVLVYGLIWESAS
jgi:hypothetical protein